MYLDKNTLDIADVNEEIIQQSDKERLYSFAKDTEFISTSPWSGTKCQMAVGIRKVTHDTTRNFMLRKYLMLANNVGKSKHEKKVFKILAVQFALCNTL